MFLNKRHNKSKWIRQNHCLIWPEENFQNYDQSLSNDVVWKLILRNWIAFHMQALLNLRN